MSSRFLFSKLSPLLATAQSPAILRLRPLSSIAGDLIHRRCSIAGGVGFRSFSIRPTTSSLNDPSPNWSNRPPKETILLDGCDFEHWLVVVEPPDPNITRDEIIDSYIKTLAQVVGSEDEARMSIYSVSTKHYFAFGAKVSEELSYKIKELPTVRWVLPDSYLDVKNKDYGGEPFINGEAVPYDPRYHEEWVRNNARANERNRRNDRPRNFDRVRNFERRREAMQNQGFQGGPNPPPQNGAPPMPNRAPQNGAPPVPNRDFYQPPPPPNGAPAMPRSDFKQPFHQNGPPTQPQPPPYQNQMPNPNYQYQGQGGGPPAYQEQGGYRGGPPAYGGGNPPYQRGSPGYQGGNPNYQGGGSNYQSGSNTGFQGHQGGNPNPNPNPNPAMPYQADAGGYQGVNSSYQGGGSAYQGRDVPERD